MEPCIIPVNQNLTLHISLSSLRRLKTKVSGHVASQKQLSTKRHAWNAPSLVLCFVCTVMYVLVRVVALVYTILQCFRSIIYFATCRGMIYCQYSFFLKYILFDAQPRQNPCSRTGLACVELSCEVRVPEEEDVLRQLKNKYFMFSKTMYDS